MLLKSPSLYCVLLESSWCVVGVFFTMCCWSLPQLIVCCWSLPIPDVLLGVFLSLSVYVLLVSSLPSHRCVVLVGPPDHMCCWSLSLFISLCVVGVFLAKSPMCCTCRSSWPHVLLVSSLPSHRCVVLVGLPDHMCCWKSSWPHVLLEVFLTTCVVGSLPDHMRSWKSSWPHVLLEVFLTTCVVGGLPNVLLKSSSPHELLEVFLMCCWSLPHHMCCWKSCCVVEVFLTTCVIGGLSNVLLKSSSPHVLLEVLLCCWSLPHLMSCWRSF